MIVGVIDAQNLVEVDAARICRPIVVRVKSNQRMPSATTATPQETIVTLRTSTPATLTARESWATADAGTPSWPWTFSTISSAMF